MPYKSSAPKSKRKVGGTLEEMWKGWKSSSSNPMKHRPKGGASKFRRADAGTKRGATPPVQDEGIATEGMPKERVNMKEKYESLENAINETTNQFSYPLIQRVSYMLRSHKNFEKHFEPRVMAIGPLHHGKKSHLQLAEQHKRRLAGQFVKESGLATDVLYSKIWTEIQDLRKRFDQEEIKLITDEELGWILFVDGCAVLQLIKCVINDKWEELKIKTNELTIILWQDLFLLENQIPFRVLELLRRSVPNQIETQRHSQNVIQELVKPNTEIESSKKTKKEDDTVTIEIESTKEEDIVEPVHLLHLLRSYLVPNTSPNSNTNEDLKNSPPPPPHPRAQQLLPGDINKFVSKIGLGVEPSTMENLSLPKKRESKKKKEEKDDSWHIVRNVKDLKSAGIYLRRSGTSLLTDISFTSWYYFAGKLTLPVLTVDDSTGPKFMNLIAYEMCPDYHNDFTVTSYLCFMDSLIDQAEDVLELRKARILLNFLGSDEEVAQLFNEISTDLVDNDDVYKSVKKKIEKHCGNKRKTWLAEFWHDHFSSPWTIVAFFTVVVVLLFTVIQTWFAAFPSNW